MNWLKNHKKLVGGVLVIVLVIFLASRLLGKSQAPVQYQTAQVTRGTLVTTVTASGQMTAGNSVNITTQASGVINNVYVHNGDSVTQGQKIADMTLDQSSQQKQQSAWASYLQAKTSLDAANANLNTLQNTEFTANQKFINDAVARGLATNDPTYVEENASWLAAEAGYQNQQTVISQAQASVSSSWLAYQQTSATITAPISGVINNLTLSPGYPIAATSNSTSTTSTTTSTQTLGSIVLPGQPQATVNLAEVDAPNVAVGQKATLTLDAFPNKTFTGKVSSVDTNGTVSSGVTTYPSVITFDAGSDQIYPNMSVNANIITNIEDNVLLVPSAAIQTQNGQSTVRVLRNNQPQTVNVEIGDANDTETVVTSGLSENDTVVTGMVSRGQTGTGSTTSVFGGGGLGGLRGGFGGGGGAARGGGRGG